jgi:hypothetical protein
MSVVFAFTPVQAMTAADLSLQAGVDSAKGKDQVTDLFGQSGVFQNITNVLLFLIGAISVIMLVIGGLRYVLSGGESSAVAAAKNTILYAIIGVIVALLAFAAVDFVINSFSATGSGGSSSGTNV